jgi:hypothetical protein
MFQSKEDQMRNTPRQEDFKKMAGIYNSKEEEVYNVNPKAGEYQPQPPNENNFVNDLMKGAQGDRPRGLEALKRDEAPAPKVKVP